MGDCQSCFKNENELVIVKTEIKAEEKIEEGNLSLKNNIFNIFNSKR